MYVESELAQILYDMTLDSSQDGELGEKEELGEYYLFDLSKYDDTEFPELYVVPGAAILKVTHAGNSVKSFETWQEAQDEWAEICNDYERFWASQYEGL